MNTETTEITVNSDTITAVSDKVENAITIMADKLGMASDHFYPIIVKQQLISGWTYIGLSVPLFLIATFLIFMGTDKSIDQEDRNWALFIGLIFYIFFIGVFGSNIPQILNPEYYALMEIKQFIK